ncbi:hypothetical protein SNE40_001073 [Patella caerulea]|uniref:EGF-like domain-containing protein n=1 Tax=Patella caerulea TaxID=87958 RepID=A0AAN8Q2H9_PATCE
MRFEVLLISALFAITVDAYRHCKKLQKNIKCAEKKMKALKCSAPVINACNSDPCQNSGTCTQDGDSFTCNCADGFTGETCETPVNACNSNPCLNSGTCTQDGNGFTCNCADGFTGDTCESEYE